MDLRDAWKEEGIDQKGRKEEREEKGATDAFGRTSSSPRKEREQTREDGEREGTER